MRSGQAKSQDTMLETFDSLLLFGTFEKKNNNNNTNEAKGSTSVHAFIEMVMTLSIDRNIRNPLHHSRVSSKQERFKKKTKGAFFWDYSRIGIPVLGIDVICVLLGAIPFSE